MTEQTLAPGSTFAGRYRVIRPLKAGGMGAVYEAEHTATSQRVALKIMRPEIVSSEALRARFAQEARVSSIIQSRYVVAVTDAGVEGSTPYLVMEFLCGQELGDVLGERLSLAPPLAAAILTQLAKGLDKAHAAGVVHRDLKPENVFLTRDEDGELVVKVLDFGIAKLVQGVSTTTIAGGTPLYMAPEQTKKGNLTQAVDVWAFGLIAFRMLSGRTFWEADSVGELYGEILGGAYPLATQRAAMPYGGAPAGGGVALPPGFDAFFSRCVALDAAARFASAGEAARAFAAIVGGPTMDAREVADAVLGLSVALNPGRTEIAAAAAPAAGSSWAGPAVASAPHPHRTVAAAPISVAAAPPVSVASGAESQSAPPRAHATSPLSGPAATIAGLAGLFGYATWAALQGAHYYAEPYLSPFYSPLVYSTPSEPAAHPHAWFGAWPAWIPSFIPMSPALLILQFPGMFRFTCYYYRKAYYRAFAGSPPGCAVGPLRAGKPYKGETSLLIFQNLHRYALYFALLYIPILYYDAWLGFWKNGQFGIGVGTIVMLVNASLIASYTFGCHSFRHLIGGGDDCMSCGKETVKFSLWKRATWFNGRHMNFAWMSLFWVTFTDLYIRLVSMGVIKDLNTWG